MGLLEKVEDMAANKLLKRETIRISYTDLAQIVKEEFIAGADDDFLKKVRKTAKGGSVITRKEMKSKNERYSFAVGEIQRGMIFGIRKTVWIFDNETNKYYQLEKDRHWKKFYKTIDSLIKSEKINRNR